MKGIKQLGISFSVALALISSVHAATEQNKSSSAILMQGFHWNSANGNWYGTLQGKASDMKNLGITHVWFPPPSDAASREGYLPRQLNVLNSSYGNGIEERYQCAEWPRDQVRCRYRDQSSGRHQ